ncbi:O-antigen ligase family protein [Geminicoccus roseus]|uniref:O-antigen ligase family protein n=1 Tax=Geminicoccus roseus TaxID=404900 RepID=UPI000485B4C6|nr:O-antigen ligase family protein [Geminicoccus roseus]
MSVRHLRLALAVWLCLLLAAAPWPLGSVIPMAALTFTVLCTATAALAMFLPSLPERRPFTAPVLIAGVLVLAVVAWMVIQVVPDMGVPFAHPGWTYAPDGEGVGSISIDPDAGVYQVIRFSGYAAMFVAVLVAATDRKLADLIYTAMMVIVTAYALYGLIAWILDFETVAGFGPVAYEGDVTSTFVNRNSWATFANLGLVLILARLAEDFENGPGSSLRARVVEMFQTITPALLLKLMAFFIVATASILSHSRGGFLSAVVALPLMLIIVLAAVRPRASFIAVSVLAVAVAGLWIVAASGEGVLARLEKLDMQFDVTAAGRLAAWTISMELIGDRPWLGHGLGSFQAVFQTSVDERFTLIYDLAHNTYIEHMLEIGVPATLLLYGAVAILFGVCVRGVFRRRRDRVFALAAVGGTLLVGLHALVDFSIQMPAIAMFYTAMLAIGCAQACPSVRTKVTRVRRTSESRPTIREELEAAPS